MIEPIHKLSGFPSVYIVSIEECGKRRQLLHDQLKDLSIKDATFLIYKRYEEYDWNVRGQFIEGISEKSLGPTTSHILTNKFWTENTDHDHALIIEDDTDLSFINLWNFKWLDFVKSLPEDWGCIQLCQMREEPWKMRFELKPRRQSDFGAQAYLIKRSYAEEMVKRYWREDGFQLDMPPCSILHDDGNEEWVQLFPIVENLVFQSIGTTYNIPFFAEDLVNTETTTTNGYYGKFRYECKDMLADKITSYRF